MEHDHDGDGKEEEEQQRRNELHLWAWKQRSGILGASLTGLASRGTITQWELRSVVVAGTTLSYYKKGQEDATSPRGIIDLVEAKVEAQVVVPSPDAPTKNQCVITSDALQLQWNFCFDQQDDLIAFLDVIHRILEKGGAYRPKDRARFEHDFHDGDHIFRWEMIVCPPVIYPIQIHGIVLAAGRNCVVVADFGLTGYGRKEGSDFNHEDDHQANAILAAWKKLRPEQDQRLTISTLTDPREIRKWTRAKYDEESFFHRGHHGTETIKKLMNTMNKIKITGSKDENSDNGEYSANDSPRQKRRHQLSKSEHSNSAVTTPLADLELPQADPTEIVLARANFLLEHMEALPPYHVFFSNSECIAVWCKTGRWSTLQTAVFLSTNSVGAAKSSIIATMGVAAAHAILAPVIAIGGLIWVSAPMVILKKSREKWEETTRIMTDLFWAQAPPAVFVAAIEHWAGLKLTENGKDNNNNNSSSSRQRLNTV